MLYVDIFNGTYQVGVTNAIPAAGSPVPVRPAVLDLSEVTYAMGSAHGGRNTCEFGSITLRTSFFEEMDAISGGWWPPPAQLSQINVGWYPDDGTAAWRIPETLVGWLDSWGSEGVVYTLRPAVGYDLDTSDYHYQGTLADAFAAVAASLGMLLNTGMARSPSPDIDWVATGKRSMYANLETMCQYCAHWFHIYDNTIHLVDLLAAAPSTSGYGPDTYMDIAYTAAAPVKRLVAPFIPLYIRFIYLEITAADNEYGVAAITRVQVSTATDGGLFDPDTVWASVSDPPHPATHAVDANDGTYWSSDVSAVPGVTFGVSLASGTIAEYTITGHTNPDYSPYEWRLFGYDAWNAQYHLLETVRAGEWDSLQARAFSVPVPTWEVTREVAAIGGPHRHPVDNVVTVEPCHPDFYCITNALAVIDSVLSRKRTRVQRPISAEIKLGYTHKYVDNVSAQGKTVTSWMRIDAITYNFTESTMVIEGYGDWT